MAIYLNPEAFKDKTIPPIKNKEHIINTTYSELKTLVDNSQLIPGMQYRITDYITTTTQENTQSANHPFDIIVIADKTNKLNCKARAVQHEGDTYFNTSQLEKWELWYDIENNTDKYVWADTVNGKGVIYRMIDAYFNDCPYDFKNIQFLYNHKEVGEDYFYTFSWIDENDDVCDCSILGNDGTLLNDEGEINGVYNNTIKPYYSYDYTTQNYTKQFLNDIKFISSYDYADGIFYGYYSNTFGNDCNSNTFGNYCNYNTFGNNCHSNTFGDYCYSNTFGNYCNSNTFGNDCYFNTFGNDCHSNTFGNNCNYNTFGNNCNYNTFGNDCNYNTFGNNCHSNTFGNDCYFNTFGNDCNYNTFGNNCHSNTFGNNCNYNTFGNNCYSNTFGNDCYYIKFASDSSASTKYNYYRHNHFGNECKYILFKGTQTASSSQQVQNYNIAQCLQGISNSYLTIDAVRNRNFETKVGRNSNGEVKQYCIEDLIA